MGSLTELLPSVAQAFKTAKHMMSQQVYHMHHASNNHQRRESTALLVMERQRMRSNYDFKRAFHRFSVSMSEKRQYVRDAKQRAKDRLRSSMNKLLASADGARALTSQTKPGFFHADGSTPQPEQTASASHQVINTSTTSEQLEKSQMETMYGTNGFLRHAILSGVASASRAFLTNYHNMEVAGSEHMEAALQRPKGQALITVCNHVSAIDDPLVVAAIMPPEYYDKPDSFRWTLCASDRCFKYKALIPFFTAAKVLPVQRGGGLKQTGMAAAENRLAQGDWVHIFPEGTRNRNPEHMLPVRKGVGRLVAAAAEGSKQTPLVVPFVHVGMEGVMPVGKALPSFDGKVRVVVGEPIPVDDLLQAAHTQAWDEDQLYVAIAQRVGHRLHRMHAALMSHDAPVTAEMQAAVSDRDLYDMADLLPTWGPKGRPMWEGAAFKMWHRGWAMHGWMSERAASVRAVKDAAKARAMVSVRAASDKLQRYGIACAASFDTAPAYMF